MYFLLYIRMYCVLQTPLQRIVCKVHINVFFHKKCTLVGQLVSLQISENSTATVHWAEIADISGWCEMALVVF